MKSNLLKQLENTLNTIKIPGLNGLGLYDLLKEFIRGLKKGLIGPRAAAISYSLFMSLFPFVIFLFSLLPLFELSDDLIYIFENKVLTRLFPDNSASIADSLSDIIGDKNLTISSTGFFLSIIFTTNGINALINGFSTTSHKLEKRNILKQYFISLFLTIIFTLLLILLLFIIYYSSPLSKYIEEKHFGYLSSYSGLISTGLAFLLSIVTFCFGVSLLYKIGPKTKFSFNEIIPGTILATILFIISAYGFGYYLQHFAQYKTLYSSLGTILILMIWIYINVTIILTGFELNVTLYKTGKLHE